MVCGAVGDCCQRYTTCARVIAILLVFAGLIFSILSAGSCDFLSFELRNGEEGNFGLFFFTNPAGSCTAYRNDTEEISFSVFDKTARTGAVVAPLFALASILFQLVDLLCWRVCCGKCIESTLLLLAIICQFLTFSAFGSKNYCLAELGHSCYISTGGIYTIIAFCLYFLGGIVGCFTPEPTPILCRENKHESSDEDSSGSGSSVDEESFESAKEVQKSN